LYERTAHGQQIDHHHGRHFGNRARRGARLRGRGVGRGGLRAPAGQASRAALGRIDVVFNNAGAFAPATVFGDLSVETWRQMVDTNLNGAFYVAREAFRAMRAQSPQGGRIINNGSISAYMPRPHAASYTATKHAISGLTKAISLDGRPYSIACGQIDIGNTATDMTAGMSSGSLQADLSKRPEPTFDVKHVVDALLYMAGLPLEANVQSMTVMATTMPYIGRG
jgi:NAD(P)-dependent dehydrogenase (short-subunit alcohol dehydrogenase family)